MAEYQGADLILLNGAGYARWVARASLPRTRVVDTSAGFRERLIPVTEGVTHAHGPDGEHAHRGFAFTTWLDPTLAVLQARAVRDAFVRAQPEAELFFDGRFDAVADGIAGMDARLAAAADAVGDVPLLFSHPVYDYLIRRYELNARQLHWEPGEDPGAAAWAALEAGQAEFPARWLLWEAEPLAATRTRLETLGIESAVFATGASSLPAGDLLSLMDAHAAALERIAGSR